MGSQEWNGRIYINLVFASALGLDVHPALGKAFRYLDCQSHMGFPRNEKTQMFG